MKWPLWIGVTLCAVVVGWMGAVAYHQSRRFWTTACPAR